MKTKREKPSEPLTEYCHHQHLNGEMNKASHFIRLEMLAMAMEAVAWDGRTSSKIKNMIDDFTVKLLVEIEGMDPKQARVACSAYRRRLSFSMAEYDERVAAEEMSKKQSGVGVLQLVKAT